jgi:hypothetical protein
VLRGFEKVVRDGKEMISDAFGENGAQRVGWGERGRRSR